MPMGEPLYVKRTLLTLCAALAVSAAGVTAAHAASTTTPSPAPKDGCASKTSKWEHQQCENYAHSAPGDEYFGRMKMSYLGINNTFRDEAIRAGAYTTDSGIIHKVDYADEALNQWMHRYPGDPQLARSYYLAIEVYKKIYTKEGQDKAWKYMQLEMHQFPDSYFGKTVKKNVGIGFTEHYFANAEMCPTPLPSGAAAPANTPAAAATPAPKKGQPKVALITPPCVKPSVMPLTAPSSGPNAVPSKSPQP
jgi:hypothetical protein